MRKVLVVVALGLLMTTASAATKGKKHTVYNCRDARTGVYVTPAYAKRYPGLTVCERK